MRAMRVIAFQADQFWSVEMRIGLLSASDSILSCSMFLYGKQEQFYIDLHIQHHLRQLRMRHLQIWPQSQVSFK